jgi:pimeloyl-ACP methyl ester carboxylesterase
MARGPVRRWISRIWIAAGLVFTTWLVWNAQPQGVPPGTFETDVRVTVTRRDGHWTFVPAGGRAGAGLVFLPGAMIDPRAYGPLARAVAEAGFPVALVELPWRLAPARAAEQAVAERAAAAQDAIDPSIPWVLAGHSRGAAIATRLMAAGPRGYDALVLVGTTHPRIDLSSLSIPIVKVGGTLDCVAGRERSEEAIPLLPARTEWIWIEGGNHAQFAFYGRQLGDCTATIAREEQFRQLVRHVARVLERLGRAGTAKA